MALQTGFGALQDAKDQMDENQGFELPEGPKTSFISWSVPEGGKPPTLTLRFINDEPLVYPKHGFIKCVDGKNRNFTCAKAFGRECWICDNVTKVSNKGKVYNVKPTDTGLAWAALREPVYEGRRVVGFNDVREDVDLDVKSFFGRVRKQFELNDDVSDENIKQILESDYGITVEGDKLKNVLAIGLVDQSISNFWSGALSLHAKYGSIADRDCDVERQGTKFNNTQYHFLPNDPVEELKEQKARDKKYEISMLVYTSPMEFVERMGTEDRYNYHMLGIDKEGNKVEQKSEEKPSESSQSASQGGFGSSGGSSDVFSQRVAQKAPEPQPEPQEEKPEEKAVPQEQEGDMIARIRAEMGKAKSESSPSEDSSESTDSFHSKLQSFRGN